MWCFIIIFDFNKKRTSRSIFKSNGTFIRTVFEEETKERLTNTRISLAKEEVKAEEQNWNNKYNVSKIWN